MQVATNHLLFLQNSEIVGAMAFVLEASDEASLPENVLCSVELNNNDFDGKIRFLEDQEI